MLTMGLTGRFVAELAGTDELTHFGGRFTAQVWPGDSLYGLAVVQAVDMGPIGEGIKLELTTTNQDRLAVFTGHATIVR
jgi:acyl dehydratase